MVFLGKHKGGRERETVFAGTVLTILDRPITNCWISIKALKEKEVKTGILCSLMRLRQYKAWCDEKQEGPRSGKFTLLFSQ